MIKRLGALFWRPENAYRDLPVKQMIWFTIFMAFLGILFVNYARNTYVRPDAVFQSFQPQNTPEYDMQYDEASAPGYPAKGGTAYEPDRGHIPEPGYGPEYGYVKTPFAVTLFGAAREFLNFAAGWMFMSAVLYWIAKRFGGSGTFGQSVSIVGLSWFPLFLRSLLQGIFIWSTGLPISWNSHLVQAVLSRLDLFIVWNLIILGVGFAAVFGIARKRALILAACYRIAIIMAALGFSMIMIR